jgi:hypothetical protein
MKRPFETSFSVTIYLTEYTEYNGKYLTQSSICVEIIYSYV